MWGESLGTRLALTSLRSLSCPHHTENFSPNTSDDGVYEYACCVLSLALFMFEFRDAVKEGDGERVYRVWKYLLLLFHESGRTKYALEALNLHLQHYGLPPHLAFEITWSRFVNSKGGKGRNIPCDLHMEHLNRELKTSILGLGANITEKSVTRSAKCLRTIVEVCDNFDNANDIHAQSSSHCAACTKKDIDALVNELSKKIKVFTEVTSRTHRSFRNFRRNRCGTIDWTKLTERFDAKKKILMVMAHNKELSCITAWFKSYYIYHNKHLYMMVGMWKCQQLQTDQN